MLFVVTAATPGQVGSDWGAQNHFTAMAGSLGVTVGRGARLILARMPLRQRGGVAQDGESVMHARAGKHGVARYHLVSKLLPG